MSRPGGFARPAAVVLTLSVLGLLPAALRGQNRAAPLLAWEDALSGTEEQPLRWPVAVSVAAEDELAVADAFRNRLLVFRHQGGTVGWRLAREIDLSAPPRSLAFDGERYLLSLRRPGGLVAVERPAYTLRQLSLPRELTPGLLAADRRGLLLVHDPAGERVVFVDGSGQIVREIGVAGYLTGLAIGPSGGFLAATTQPPEIRRYAANGELMAAWPVPGLAPAPAWPVGLTVDTAGDTLVADRHGGRLLLFNATGQLLGQGSRQGWEPGLLRLPADSSDFPDGRIAVADQGNGRVQIFRTLAQSGSP